MKDTITINCNYNIGGLLQAGGCSRNQGVRRVSHNLQPPEWGPIVGDLICAHVAAAILFWSGFGSPRI